MSVDVNLAVLRLNEGKSIRGLARELGINEHTLRRLETGEAVHPSTAKKVADHFGVKVTDLPAFSEMVA